MCDMPHSYVWHDDFICVTCLIHVSRAPVHMIWDSNQLDWHIHMWYGLISMCDMIFICVTCRIHTCDMPHSHVWHDSFICVTCDMTHSHVWHASVIYQGHPFTWFVIVISWIRIFIRVTDSFLCVTWLIPTCEIPHSYVWHASFACVAWLIHMCDLWHDSFMYQGYPFTWFVIVISWIHILIRVTDSFLCVMWRIHKCDMTHSYVWHDSFICVTCLIHRSDMSHSCIKGTRSHDLW